MDGRPALPPTRRVPPPEVPGQEPPDRRARPPPARRDRPPAPPAGRGAGGGAGRSGLAARAAGRRAGARLAGAPASAGAPAPRGRRRRSGPGPPGPPVLRRRRPAACGRPLRASPSTCPPRRGDGRSPSPAWSSARLPQALLYGRGACSPDASTSDHQRVTAGSASRWSHRLARPLRLAGARRLALLAAQRRPLARALGVPAPDQGVLLGGPARAHRRLRREHRPRLDRQPQAAGDRQRVPPHRAGRRHVHPGGRGDGAALRGDRLPRLPLPRVRQLWGWVWGALAPRPPSSALAHLQLDVFVPLAALGFVLAWAYHRTGSLWTCITMHALFNLIAVLAWALHELSGRLPRRPGARPDAARAQVSSVGLRSSRQWQSSPGGRAARASSRMRPMSPASSRKICASTSCSHSRTTPSP